MVNDHCFVPRTNESKIGGNRLMVREERFKGDPMVSFSTQSVVGKLPPSVWDDLLEKARGSFRGGYNTF